MAAILSLNFFVKLILLIILAEWIRRIFWMRKFLTGNPPITAGKKDALEKNSFAPLEKVSIIVPARNEEKNITRCLKHLAEQDLSNYEIIAVDDRSDDRTGHLIDNMKRISSVPIKSLRIEKLPPGWTGKNHAMLAGSKAASGQWLLFTDADTTHQSFSASRALETARANKIDFLTLAPKVECVSFWENMIQPLAVSSLALWFNTAELNQPGSKTVLANGQFILIKKDVYEKIGGNESVKNEVVEDVELAKKVKQAGYNVKFLNGTLLYSTRMYSSLRQIITGWTRIFVHLFNKKLSSIFHKIFLFIFFSTLPFVILFYELILMSLNSAILDTSVLFLSASVCAGIVCLRFLGNRSVQSNPWFAFWHPVSSAVMTWILFICAWRIIANAPSEWRGDKY